MHAALTVIIFLATMVLIFVRPKGLSEAWAAVLGAGFMLALGLVSWRQAVVTSLASGDVLLFLFALMIFSGLLEQSGFFEWAAILAARAARGSAHALFGNVFLLGFLTTALLSLDTTAILLTPIVLAFVARLKLRSKPFLIACAFVANTGSLLLPVSNLTNLLVANGFHLNFDRFALTMALPQIAALVVNYLIFRRLFRNDLEGVFNPKDLPDPMSVVPDRIYCGASLIALAAVVIGYFVASLAGIPPYLVAFAGCVFLLAVGVVRGKIAWKRLAGEISLPLFAFVVGLFVVIRGVENLGISQMAAHALDGGKSPLVQIVIAAFGAGIGSNVINNIPMVLLDISILHNAGGSAPQVYGALLGCNIGPNLTLAGSLATMLVITSARKRGEEIGAKGFFRAGVLTTPLVLLASCLALRLVLLVLR